jgi:hypothetical protein
MFQASKCLQLQMHPFLHQILRAKTPAGFDLLQPRWRRPVAAKRAKGFDRSRVAEVSKRRLVTLIVALRAA